MKNRNNKGFSLVELIVVVAIMAVLVGVLAPAYLKYVEQSREKKDANNLEEVRHAVEIALAEESIYSNTFPTGTTTVTVTIADNAAITTSTGSLLAAELAKTVGTVDLASKKYTDAGANTTVTVTLTGGTVTVKGNWPS